MVIEDAQRFLDDGLRLRCLAATISDKDKDAPLGQCQNPAWKGDHCRFHHPEWRAKKRMRPPKSMGEVAHEQLMHQMAIDLLASRVVLAAREVLKNGLAAVPPLEDAMVSMDDYIEETKPEC